MIMRWREDRGSMPMALLLILIGVSLSSLLATTVIVQIRTTRASAERVHALDAAQAGIDVALAHLRAARDGIDDDGNPVGDLRSLPCQVSGSVSAGGPARYEVKITYFQSDPHARPDSWVDAAGNSDRIPCTTGSGVPSTPAYALLRARGTDLAGGDIATVTNRYLRATYTLQQTNENVPGGLIHVFRAEFGKDLCLDAGSGRPAAGTRLRVQLCSPGSPGQIFSYSNRLNLVLVPSKTTESPLGMCLEADEPAGGSVKYVTLQQCADTTQRNQQWAFNGAANFEGVAADGDRPKPLYCFHIQTPDTAGSYLVAEKDCGGGYGIEQSFAVEASVGAGMAGSATGQLVNFNQFGRCADVTEAKLNYKDKYLIVWPCKQSAIGDVPWNEKWTLPAAGTSGTVVTNPTSGAYCLQSPRSTVPRAYVWVVPCPTGTVPADLTWTRYEATDSIRTSYTIQDADGHCLAPTDPNDDPPDFYPRAGVDVSKLVVAECNGTTLQKWNAPASVGDPAPLKDIGEDLGTN